MRSRRNTAFVRTLISSHPRRPEAFPLHNMPAHPRRPLTRGTRKRAPCGARPLRAQGAVNRAARIHAAPYTAPTPRLSAVRVPVCRNTGRIAAACAGIPAASVSRAHHPRSAAAIPCGARQGGLRPASRGIPRFTPHRWAPLLNPEPGPCRGWRLPENGNPRARTPKKPSCKKSSKKPDTVFVNFAARLKVFTAGRFFFTGTWHVDFPSFSGPRHLPLRKLRGSSI